MGRQINFYYNKELEKEFFEYINSVQATLFVTKQFKGLESVKKYHILENEKKEWEKYYITTENLDEIKYKILNNGAVSLSEYDEFVIEYNSTFDCITNDKNILVCRLYYENYYFVNDERIKKPDRISKLYNKLTRWVHSHCPSVNRTVYGVTYTDYMSPDVKVKIQKVLDIT